MMEDINNIINIGEIPNLILPEDWEEILYDMKSIFKDKYDLNNKNVLIKVFKHNIRTNLHIILSF